MSFLIGFLTVILVLNCLLLILLVLIQLPKKEAGAGLAFGGAATDALFGAGSGNVLTKVTKYATVIFFVLSMAVAIMQSEYYHRPGTAFRRAMEKQSQPPAQPSPIPQSGAPQTPPVSGEPSIPPLTVPNASAPTSAPAPTTPN
jgi:preprotein translocase subunit SecG